MDRQKAATIAMGIPEGQLPAALHRVDSVVDVQRSTNGSPYLGTTAERGNTLHVDQMKFYG